MSTWLGKRVPRYLLKHYSGCSWTRLAFELANWVTQISLPNVSRPNPIKWRQDDSKDADLPTSKKEFLLPNYLWTGTLAFFLYWEILKFFYSYIRIQTQTLTLPGLQSSWTSRQKAIDFHYSKAFLLRLDPDPWLSWVCCLPTHTAHLKTCCYRNRVSHFLILYHIYI